jgi:hypothetical protein
MATIISQKLEATNLETRRNGYLSLDGLFHEPDQWARPFFNEEAMQFK